MNKTKFRRLYVYKQSGVHFVHLLRFPDIRIDPINEAGRSAWGAHLELTGNRR